jgi:hypothetical protein
MGANDIAHRTSVLEFLQVLKKHGKPKASTDGKWRSPVLGTLKFNVDAVFLPPTESCQLGCLSSATRREKMSLCGLDVWSAFEMRLRSS